MMMLFSLLITLGLVQSAYPGPYRNSGHVYEKNQEGISTPEKSATRGCKRVKRVRAVLKHANEDCLLNEPGETNGETFIGTGFKTPDECAKACVCKEKRTKFIAYGKTTGCTGDFGCFNPTACFCEKTRKCDKRIDATNIYDVYKIRRNRRGKPRAQIGVETLLGQCQNSVTAKKKYTGADCNDIKVNGEVYLGSKDTPEQCAHACSCQYPGTKYFTYGKKAGCGDLGCLNPKACFCEKTQSCSSQDSVGWYDVYTIEPKGSSQMVSAALVGGVALFGISAGLYVKTRNANKQIENYELLSSEHV